MKPESESSTHILYSTCIFSIAFCDQLDCLLGFDLRVLYSTVKLHTPGVAAEPPTIFEAIDPSFASDRNGNAPPAYSII